MRLGIDTAFAGSTADFDEAESAGVEWVGEYFGGAGCFHTWTNNDRAALAASKIPYRLPIWVPGQSFNSNPIDEANVALNAHKLLGFKRVIALDAERNSGFTLEWGETFGKELVNAGIDMVLYHGGDKQSPSMAADWLASWTGNPPSQLGSRKARQYRGNTNSYGMSVDFDIAADDFPLEGLPNTNGGITTVDNDTIPSGKLVRPVCCAIEKPDNTGGWLICQDGGVINWGSARFFGSIPALGVKPYGDTSGGKTLASPIVAAVPAQDGNGYTLIGGDGGTFPFGSGPKIPSLA